MRKIVFLVLLSFLVNFGFCQMLPISDSKLISSSENIIQGTVISSKSLWVNNNKYIYTFSKVKVDVVFSGSCCVGDIITVVTPGGYDPIKDVRMGVSSQPLLNPANKLFFTLLQLKERWMRLTILS